MKKLLKALFTIWKFTEMHRIINIFYDVQCYVIIALDTKVEMIGQIEEEERVISRQ